MQPKPSHWSGEYGAWFKDPQVVAAYHYRPPYPAEVVETLVSLVQDTPRTVLDIGCGTGDLARRLAPLVDGVDAVDFSEGMLEKGRRLPGGDHPHLHWIHATFEDAPLSPPYALVTAGESLHWMAWEIVLPRLAQVLAPHAVLAIAERSWDGPPPLREALLPIFACYSPVRDYRPTHMGPATTAAFDDAVRQVLAALTRDGVIEQHQGRLSLSVGASVIWGTPLDPLV